MARIEESINVLNNYIVKLDSFDINFIKYYIEHKGFDNAFNYILENSDCSVIKDNKRLIQTIDYTYKSNISSLSYMIESLQDNKEIYIEKIISLHNKNLEFERDNPPIVYPTKTKKSIKRTSTPKQKDLFENTISNVNPKFIGIVAKIKLKTK